MNPAYRVFCELIAYSFKDLDLLAQALTHRSAASRHNERIEFLGDSVLNFVISDALFSRFPKATEGELSRLRAILVREQTLADLARELNIGDYIRLGSGELKSGGYRRESILADALEAVFGAVYLDGGFDECKRTILRLFEQRIIDVDAVTELKDAKSRLQEWLQSRRLALPNYTVLSVTGDPHQQQFFIECRIDEINIVTESEGTSRRRAEQLAAEKALTIIAERKLP